MTEIKIKKKEGEGEEYQELARMWNNKSHTLLVGYKLVQLIRKQICVPVR